MTEDVLRFDDEGTYLDPKYTRPQGDAEPNRCAWCGRMSYPAKSDFLRRLFPERTFCRGCGVIQIHCTCKPKT